MNDPTTNQTAVPVCQSCGMPLNDPTDYGSDAGGNQNHEYCAYCYQEGNFTDPEATLDSKAAEVAKFAAERQGIKLEAALPSTRERLKTLKRWQVQ